MHRDVRCSSIWSLDATTEERKISFKRYIYKIEIEFYILDPAFFITFFFSFKGLYFYNIRKKLAILDTHPPPH